MLRKRLLWVLVALLPSYSYSDSIAPYYGTTDNAAANAHNWVMQNILPDAAGLDINAIIYNYTIQKEQGDRVDVYVQNENANGSGYIFREHDAWLPGSLGGTEIDKVVPVVPNIPRASWGDGSIEVEGDGSVTDASVIYSYRVDPCFNPQYDPNCPGYEAPEVEIPEVDLTNLYDVTSDPNVSLDYEVDEEQIEKKDLEEESTEDEEEKERESKERLEKALAAADNSALFAQALVQAQILASINAATNLTPYYSANINGGVYKESIQLIDSKIPENRKGLRNGLAQQLLHEKMIESQYK